MPLLLLAACATTPPPRPARRVAAVPAVPPAAAPQPGTPRTAALEERDVGEAPELPPAPEALAAIPPGPAEELEKPSTASVPAEPDSLLSRIGPNTPPNVAAALRLIEDGRQQLQQGSADPALERFERAVAIDPANPYGYYFLAQLHYQKKKYDQAIAFANRAVVFSARTDTVWQARAYSLQGAVYEDAGRYPDARWAYQKAVEADPNNLAARVGVARLTPSESQP